MNNNELNKIKNLIISVLQDAQNNYMRKKQFVWTIILTILPILIFSVMPLLENRYFEMFAGRLIYLSKDYYFSISPLLILDLPYFFTPIISASAVWFCLKIRKSIEDRKSFFNYLTLVLIVFNFIICAFSLWTIFSILM